MSFEIGPVLRTVRRRPGVWALLVLEVAVGVTTIGSLLISGAWYGDAGQRPSGFDEPNLILISTYTPSPPGADPAAAEQAIRAQERADRALARATPGVVAATRVTSTILEDKWSYPSRFLAPAEAPGAQAAGWSIYADGEVARALGLRFVAGGLPAGPDAGEAADGLGDRPLAAVLTRCLAERLFTSPAAAIGARLSSEQGTGVPVIGVIEDVTMRMALMPNHRCAALYFGGSPVDHESRLVVRVRPGTRDAVLAALTQALGRGSASRFAEVRAFDSSTGTHYRVGRGLLMLLGIFGGMLALVALLGVLAATSFLVAQRTRQIGIRRALGATRGDIVSYFLVESALAAAMGSVIGVVATAGLFVVMRQVFQAITFRPGLMALALATLWAGSLLATLIPALRAARVSPSVAGRSL